MTKLKKFAVDFYLAGTVIVKARDRDSSTRFSGWRLTNFTPSHSSRG